MRCCWWRTTLPAELGLVTMSVVQVDAEKRYNKRVTEGKLAAKLVGKAAGVASWQTLQTLRQLQEALALATPGALLPLIEEHLAADAYSLDDLASAFGCEPAALFETDPKKAGALKVINGVARGEKTFELQSTCCTRCGCPRRLPSPLLPDGHTCVDVYLQSVHDMWHLRRSVLMRSNLRVLARQKAPSWRHWVGS